MKHTPQARLARVKILYNKLLYGKHSINDENKNLMSSIIKKDDYRYFYRCQIQII